MLIIKFILTKKDAKCGEFELLHLVLTSPTTLRLQLLSVVTLKNQQH